MSNREGSKITAIKDGLTQTASAVNFLLSVGKLMDGVM